MNYLVSAVILFPFGSPLVADGFNPKTHILKLEFAFLHDPDYEVVKGERCVHFNDGKSEYILEGVFTIRRVDEGRIDKDKVARLINADLCKLLNDKIDLRNAEATKYREAREIGAYTVKARIDLHWKDDGGLKVHFGAYIVRTPDDG